MVFGLLIVNMGRETRIIALLCFALRLVDMGKERVFPPDFGGTADIQCCSQQIMLAATHRDIILLFCGNDIDDAQKCIGTI